MRTDRGLPAPAPVWQVWLLAGVVVFLSGVGAQASEISLEVQVPEQAFTVGDPVPLRVLARGSDDVLWGQLTARVGNDGDWAVADGPREMPGSSPPSWELVLIPLKVGELELPQLEAGFRRQDGEPEKVTAEQPGIVTVASVLAPEDSGEPAPLRGPLGVQGFPWEWVVPIACVVIPILALLIWWWRRRTGEEERAAISKLPPFEELQHLLNDLRNRIGREPAEVVCDRLASGIRLYLERRTGEPAAEMTSHELQVLSRKSGWPGEVQGALLKVTGVADGVRFGRRPTGDHELDEARGLALQMGRDLEHHFTPRDEEVA